jgi:hypothetical protein
MMERLKKRASEIYGKRPGLQQGREHMRINHKMSAVFAIANSAVFNRMEMLRGEFAKTRSTGSMFFHVGAIRISGSGFISPLSARRPSTW